jgi:hypothetical protein
LSTVGELIEKEGTIEIETIRSKSLGSEFTNVFAGNLNMEENKRGNYIYFKAWENSKEGLLRV